MIKANTANNVNHHDWVTWINDVKVNPQHNNIVVYSGKVQYLTPSVAKTLSCSKVKTSEIVDLSKKILSANVLSVDEKSDLTKGLQHIVQSRQNRFNKLNFIKRIFATIFGYRRELSKLNSEVASLTKIFQSTKPPSGNNLPPLGGKPLNPGGNPLNPGGNGGNIFNKPPLNPPFKPPYNWNPSSPIAPPIVTPPKIDFQSIYKPSYAVVAGEDKNGTEQYELTSLLESVDLRDEETLGKPYLVDDLQLKEGIDAYMKDEYMKNPKNRTTLYLLSEKLAGRFIENGDFISAMEVRVSAAEKLCPDERFINIVQEIADNKEEGLGAKIAGLGSIYLKNHVFHAEVRKKTDNKDYVHLEAKLNHFFRPRFDKTLEFLNASEACRAKFEKALPKGFCHSVQITKEADVFEAANSNNVFSSTGVNTGAQLYTINFEGVGKVKIGADAQNYCQYNRLVVELDPSIKLSEAGEKMHILLSSLGLGALAYPSRKVDYDRNKLFQLFRLYHPAISYKLEREEFNFECSIPDLIKTMIEALKDDQKTSMAQKFKLCLEDQSEEFMYRMKVYKNYHIWAMRDFSKELKKKGARGLFCGLGYGNNGDVAQLVVNIIKKGALSSQDRFQNGLSNHGASSLTDLNGGGGDCVYTRMIPKVWIDNQHNISSCYAAGQVQLLYDLDVLDRGAYAYTSDTFGKKTETAYSGRQNLIQFSEQLQNMGGTSGNEVMIKNRISKSHLRGILVQKQEMANSLTDALKKNGIYMINNVAIEKLIHVGSSVPAQVFA